MLGVSEKKNRGEERDKASESENAQAESEILPKRQASHEVGGDEARKYAHAAVGESEAEDGAGGNDDESFGDELANQAQRRSAERAADSDFATAAFGADEKQAGDVDAGDDEQERGPAEQNEEDGAKIAGDDSESGATKAPWSRLVSGYSCSSCCAIDVTLASACCKVTPSLRRATP